VQNPPHNPHLLLARLLFFVDNRDFTASLPLSSLWHHSPSDLLFSFCCVRWHMAFRPLQQPWVTSKRAGSGDSQRGKRRVEPSMGGRARARIRAISTSFSMSLAKSSLGAPATSSRFAHWLESLLWCFCCIIFLFRVSRATLSFSLSASRFAWCLRISAYCTSVFVKPESRRSNEETCPVPILLFATVDSSASRSM
jgi:hypothetical protein